MERVPNGRYAKEFREEAVKMVTDGGLSVLEVASRFGLLRITWIQRGDVRICQGVMRKGSKKKQRPPVEAVPELLLPPLVDELVLL